MTKALSLVVLLGFICCALLHADTLVFKNGQELEGDVLNDDDTSILLKVEAGTLRIEKSKLLYVKKWTEEELEKRKEEEDKQQKFQARMERMGKTFYRGEWIAKERKDKIMAELEEQKRIKKEADLKAKEAKKKADEEARKKHEKEQEEIAKKAERGNQKEDGITARERIRNGRGIGDEEKTNTRDRNKRLSREEEKKLIQKELLKNMPQIQNMLDQ